VSSAPRNKQLQRVASINELMKRVPYLQPHGLLTFEVPKNASPEQVELAHRIGLLDKRAHRELGVGTPAWEAVIQLLVNAISLGVEGGEVANARELLQEAQKVFLFYRNLTTRNRLVYLGGILVGILGLTLLSATLGVGLEPELSARKLVLATTFGGLGTVASVLSRLNQIEELENDHSLVNVFISGAGRPIVAAILAVIVGIVLDLKIVTIQVGTEAGSSALVNLVAAFLCGFSERFAGEILGRILPPDSKQASDAQS
jgi:hypothetical protein